MRIKPWVLTGAATCIAVAAVGVVVSTGEPTAADFRQLMFFWIALGAGIWAAFVTVFLAIRMNLAQSVWVGFVWTVASIATLLLLRAGYRDRRLLGAMLFVTLCVSFAFWRSFRHGRT